MEALSLPPAGRCRTLEQRRGLLVVEQTSGGVRLRWLCSLRKTCAGAAMPSASSRSSSQLLAQSVVVCSPHPRRTRVGGAVVFDRSILMPQYHSAMVAGLALHPGVLRRALLLGVGGGALAMFLRQTYPHLILTCVDSSRAAVELGKRYFGLLPSKRLKVLVESAETYVNQAPPDELYDAILVDTCDSVADDEPHGGMVAPHRALRRRRSVLAFLEHLAPCGVLVINVLGDDSSVNKLEQMLRGLLSRTMVWQMAGMRM
ncbi:MAG: hypothetical protein SGPRY_007865 [Prymnesium sp.]